MGGTMRSEHHELLQRVLNSAEFRRSTRLREFLRYVGERALEGAHYIHEQEIGTHVFERRESYDTSLDNIVRVNATLLRRRLELYFTGEGEHEKTTIVIARGGYVPAFVDRGQDQPDTPAVPGAENPEAEPEEQEDDPGEEGASPPLGDPEGTVRVPLAARRVPLPWFAAVGMLAVFLAGSCVALLVDRRHPVAAGSMLVGKSARDRFWGPLLRGPIQTDLVLGDTSFALTEDLLNRQIPLKDFVSQRYMVLFDDPALLPQQRANLHTIVSRNNGSVAEFRFASELFRPSGDSHGLSLLSAREFNPADLNTRNVILVGSQKANPWVQLFDDQLNFTFKDNSLSGGATVVNRHPLAGEASEYVLHADRSAYSGFCVIAYLRNSEGTGDVLLLEGSGSEETQAAGEFLVSEPAMKAFAERIGQPGLPHFEMVLRTRKLYGAPLTSEIVAYRVH